MTLIVLIVSCLLAFVESRTRFPRLVGGYDAKPGESPYQVSLQWEHPSQTTPTHFCSGSILSKDWIVTAAHCIMAIKCAPEGTFYVKAGKHSLQVANKPYEQTSRIDRTIVHFMYSKFAIGLPYDIALIKLDTPFFINERVAPIELPNKDSKPNGTAVLSGWGKINDDSRYAEYPKVLQTANVSIIDHKTCIKALENPAFENKVVFRNVIGETNICTDSLSGDIAPCNGDSGSPLAIRKKNGKFELVGIVSWGVDPCGRKGIPSVYVRVSSFVDWINEKMLIF